MSSKLLLALSLIATLLHLSSCVGTIAVATSSKKQTVTFQLPNEKSKLYVNDSFYGQGATLKIKVPRIFNTKVRIETEGYKTIYDVLPLYKKSKKLYLSGLDIPLSMGVMRGFFKNVLELPGSEGVATGAIIGTVMILPIDFLIAYLNPKSSRFISARKFQKIYSNIQKQKEQKNLLVKSVSFAVSKEKNTFKICPLKAYFKNPEKAEKNTKSQPDKSGEIKGEAGKLVDALNELLLQSGFIDSTNETLLKSKINEMYLQGEITDFETVYISNSTTFAAWCFYYKINCKWMLKDAYGNLKKEIDIKSNSGVFFNNHSLAVDSANFEALNDGIKTNLHGLFENQEFKALLKTENANENANTVVQNISRPTQKPQSFEDAMQACATILVEKNKEKGHGSGFFISTDGYLITNYHVVVGMDKITVKTNDGKTHSAKVLRFDFENDLALLKIEATSPFAFEIPNDKNYKIGIDVFTIGTPSYESLGQTLSKGILSGARTSEVGNEVLQTDVSVNPGNSGGPLLNKEFQLIGVVNSKLMGRGVEGIAFGSAAKDLLKQLNLAY